MLAVLQCWATQPSAHAQAFDIDLDPPLIEHAPLSENEAGISQSFLAQVVDDRELASVSLFWRYAGETRYASLAMNRVSDPADL